MSMDFQVVVKPQYVVAHFQESFESSALYDLWQDIFAAAVENDRKAVLVDIRDTNGDPPTTVERYDHGVRIAELQWGPGAGIGLAVVGNEPIVDPDRFAQVVSANRGAFARVFTDLDEAVDWIEEVAVHAKWAR